MQIKAALRIAKSPEEVFEAIVNPEHMSHYFIAKSDGRMEEGKTLHWQFPEFEMVFPVHVKKIEPFTKISYTWNDLDGVETLVEMTLNLSSEGATFLVITEGEKEANEANIEWLKRNTEGWANFLACLKAYLEYGINLRKGAFDPSQMPVKEELSENQSI